MLMIQYAVDVPTPSADRLKPKTLEIHEFAGGGGFAPGFDYVTQTADLTNASKTVMFEMPYFVPHLSDDSMRAVKFYCLFRFENLSGSRSETHQVTPRKVAA